MNEREVHAVMLRALHQAGVDPAIIYAFDQTGRIVTDENKTLLTPDELEEWDDAVAAYRRAHPEER